MNISGVSAYQQAGDNFDIILSVDFGKSAMEQYGLVSTTVFFTCDEAGAFKFATICDEGFPTDLELEPEELKDIHRYVEDNGLIEKLFLATTK